MGHEFQTERDCLCLSLPLPLPCACSTSSPRLRPQKLLSLRSVAAALQGGSEQAIESGLHSTLAELTKAKNATKAAEFERHTAASFKSCGAFSGGFGAKYSKIIDIVGLKRPVQVFLSVLFCSCLSVLFLSVRVFLSVQLFSEFCAVLFCSLSIAQLVKRPVAFESLIESPSNRLRIFGSSSGAKPAQLSLHALSLDEGGASATEPASV